jgi:hypothetical protein
MAAEVSRYSAWQYMRVHSTSLQVIDGDTTDGDTTNCERGDQAVV